MFENMGHLQWQNTIRSKVASSWNLHANLTDMDFFVLLSSVSGVTGNPGQSNYAAGCTFQDALAQHRTKRGLKATSIDLGVMRNVGVVAESASLQKRFDSDTHGLGQVKEQELLALLDMCCCDAAAASLGPSPDLSTGQIIMGLNTPVDFLARSLEPPGIMQRPLFSHFERLASPSHHDAGSGAENFADMFRRAETSPERAGLVVRALAKRLARALAIDFEDVDEGKPLHAFGVDSLVAVELRNWIAKSFAAEVPVYELVGGRTVESVAQLVERTSEVRKSS